MIFLLDLLLGYFEPHHMAVPFFNSRNRDVVVMYTLMNPFFTTKKSRLIASMSPMSTSSLVWTDLFVTSIQVDFVDSLILIS